MVRVDAKSSHDDKRQASSGTEAGIGTSLEDLRPAAAAQRKLQHLADTSARARQLHAIQLMAQPGPISSPVASNAPIQFAREGEEYFDRALHLLCQHVPAVAATAAYLRVEFNTGRFDAHIRAETLLEALKAAAREAPLEAQVAVAPAAAAAVAVGTYEEARKLASDTNLMDGTYFTRFGGGVNKQAFGVNRSKWVVLAAPESKARLIAAEIEQILALKARGVDTPDLGSVAGADSAMFAVNMGGERRIGFLEENIPGFEIPRAGTAFSEDEVRRFGDMVAEFIGGEADLETAKAKRAAALSSIDKLGAQIASADIPDFQVRFDRSTGRILTLDPGDPENSENAQVKHVRWLAIWTRTLTDTRYLKSLFDRAHPDAKMGAHTSWNS